MSDESALADAKARMRELMQWLQSVTVTLAAAGTISGSLGLFGQVDATWTCGDVVWLAAGPVVVFGLSFLLVVIAIGVAMRNQHHTLQKKSGHDRSRYAIAAQRLTALAVVALVTGVAWFGVSALLIALRTVAVG